MKGLQIIALYNNALCGTKRLQTVFIVLSFTVPCQSKRRWEEKETTAFKVL